MSQFHKPIEERIETYKSKLLLVLKLVGFLTGTVLETQN